MKIYSMVYQNGNSLYTEVYTTPEGALAHLLEDVKEYTENDTDALDSMEIWDCTEADGGRLFCVYDSLGFVLTIFETDLYS